MPRIIPRERTTARAIIVATFFATFFATLCSSPSVSAAEDPTEGDDRWTSYVALGAQLLPDYDENGRGSGLNKQEFFALVTADGRFGEDCTGSSMSSGFKTCANPLTGPWHTGVALTLLGTPVQREDKPSISPTEFNDVARTAVISGYFFLPMVQSNDRVDNFAPSRPADSRANRNGRGDHDDREP